MTDPTDLGAPEPDSLDGHTIEQLSDYLDSGRNPRNAHIDSSPSCQIALSAMERLSSTTWALLETKAAAEPARDDLWISRMLSNITREAKAGRDIPISDPDPTAVLSVTEGSVRGLIRAVGDGIGGAIVGKCDLDGDVSVPGEPIEVNVTASVAWGENLVELAEHMRQKITGALALHTELNVTGVNVTIKDIHARTEASTKETR